jgi:hypothetical protein
MGKIRDCSFENQSHQASGLSPVVAAITLKLTIQHLRLNGQLAKVYLLRRVSY